MPAHVKSSVFGCSLMVPISGGRLALGTWQVGALPRRATPVCRPCRVTTPRDLCRRNCQRMYASMILW